MAEAAYQRALAIDPKNASPLDTLGMALQNLCRLDEALLKFNKYVGNLENA